MNPIIIAIIPRLYIYIYINMQYNYILQYPYLENHDNLNIYESSSSEHRVREMNSL